MSGLYLVCILCMYKPTFLKQYMKILGVAITTRHPNQTLDSNLFVKTSYPMARPNGSRQPECSAVPQTISSGSVSVLLRNIWNKYRTLQWCKFSPHISLHVLLDRRLGQLSPPFLITSEAHVCSWVPKLRDYPKLYPWTGHISHNFSIPYLGHRDLPTDNGQISLVRVLYQTSLPTFGRWKLCLSYSWEINIY